MYRQLTNEQVIAYGKQLQMVEYQKKLFGLIESWAATNHENWGHVVEATLHFQHSYNDEGGYNDYLYSFDVTFSGGKSVEISAGEDMDDDKFKEYGFYVDSIDEEVERQFMTEDRLEHSDEYFQPVTFDSRNPPALDYKAVYVDN